MLICDTSGLLALFDAGDAHNAPVTEAVEADAGPFIVSPYVIAELDYLLATRRGVREQVAALQELATGAWDLASMTARDLETITGIIERYQDQAVGAADASLVVLAARYRTTRVLTLDRRHYTVLRTLTERRFNVVPVDA